MRCRAFCGCAGCGLEAFAALAWAFHLGWATWAQHSVRVAARALGARA